MGMAMLGSRDSRVDSHAHLFLSLFGYSMWKSDYNRGICGKNHFEGVPGKLPLPPSHVKDGSMPFVLHFNGATAEEDGVLGGKFVCYLFVFVI